MQYQFTVQISHTNAQLIIIFNTLQCKILQRPPSPTACKVKQKWKECYLSKFSKESVAYYQNS